MGSRGASLSRADPQPCARKGELWGAHPDRPWGGPPTLSLETEDVTLGASYVARQSIREVYQALLWPGSRVSPLRRVAGTSRTTGPRGQIPPSTRSGDSPVCRGTRRTQNPQSLVCL